MLVKRKGKGRKKKHPAISAARDADDEDMDRQSETEGGEIQDCIDCTRANLLRLPTYIVPLRPRLPLSSVDVERLRAFAASCMVLDFSWTFPAVPPAPSHQFLLLSRFSCASLWTESTIGTSPLLMKRKIP